MRQAMQLCFMLSLLPAGVGCVESYWKIPYPAGEQPSKLWTSDPRTQGWNGVEVEYALLTHGGVEAVVRSADGRHEFKQRGDFWFEDEQGNRPQTYKEQVLLAVSFNGREERYRFTHKPGIDRGLIVLAEP